MKRRKPPDGVGQLDLPFEPTRPELRLIPGGAQERPAEPLTTPDAVVRLLVEAGADLLLRKITPERAHEIERSVGRVLDLFERVEKDPTAEPGLRRELRGLQTLMTESRSRRSRNAR